ncbi:6-pyruvoyl trahydropterin synthase family protein [Rheinheimera sp. 4Y26]|uniref:6-pyruvoyl trahydropterin synthase family protein n=1 Tax=Rheinheimera sp. 4Y26 TaxID=2977811 RepID=UPI0021B10CB7|nr:6-carboxytetrahydropterin synthase [Rheinheimera sp. 4Y26]MCT6699320.1 6-carboxytetrahydropterin synthase [Rheinheimera sp. 4Y26]
MILFVRDLTVIDFSYLCQQRGLLGESYIVDVELHGELNATSMVFDFGHVKKVIKKAIDSLVDHKLAYPASADCLVQQQQGETHILQWQSERGLIQIASPAEAHVAIPGHAIHEQSVALFLTEQITPLLPANVTALKFQLRTERSNSFYYHYSHGLKKHDGNCQRIAHGHRSTIEIYQNGMLSPRLNKYWTERWQDIYLGTSEDLVKPEQLQFIKANTEDHSFRYQAPQGWFEISLPKNHCEIVPCDTTVECLADYIADQLQQMEAADYKVVAYEGVGKGAIAFS